MGRCDAGRCDVVSLSELLNVILSLVTKCLIVAMWQCGKVASATAYCLRIKVYYVSLYRVLRFVSREVTSLPLSPRGVDSHTLSWPLLGQSLR